jgi:hypothetical protein
MRRFLLVVAAILAASVFAANRAQAFGVKDVIQMHRDGIADSLIVQKIRYSGKAFHLDANDLRDLKREGIPDEIVSEMLATERRDDYPYYGGYYYPYGPYHYYYPRVVVGFGYYGYYGHPYYRRYVRPFPYYAPRYRGYVRGGVGVRYRR